MNERDFEYAVRADVRNNPVVREVDRQRQRELWWWAAVGSVLVVVLLFTALQQFNLIRYGYEIERMQRQRVAEERLNRQLLLELETLRAPQRLQEIATGELRLVTPTMAEAVVIERVISAEPPSNALVASR
jgi:cell division protein FtsL